MSESADLTSTSRVVDAGAPPLWHVTLTMSGEPVDPMELRRSLDRLADEQPFLLAARYAPERVELRYWEEAACVDDAAALALRLWGEHRASAGLPAWAVVGLEVVGRTIFLLRASEGGPAAKPLVPAGGIRPF